MGILAQPQSNYLYCLMSCATKRQLSPLSRSDKDIREFITRAPMNQYTVAVVKISSTKKGKILKEKSPEDLILVKQFLPRDLHHLATQ